MIYFSTLLISMFITIALIPAFRSLAVRVNAVDVPNHRKVHSCPMPKSGGIAMALGALIPVLLWAPGGEFVRAVLIGAGIVVFFGLMDDFRDLGYKAKFTGQCAAALIVIIYGGVKIKSLGMLLPGDMLLSDWLAIPLTLIVIVGVTNAVNLSDGLDGLAGGSSLLSFLCIGYLAYLGENIVIAMMSVAVIGAIFGFLRFNTYPANLFMGDSGSQLLGFSGITLLLALAQGNTPLSPILPLIVLGFPVLDTLTVMSERLAEGRPPFIADKNHFHHKLMRLGFFHTEAVFIIYILQAFLVTCALLFRFYSEWFLLTGYLICSGLILSGFFIADRSHWKFKRYDLLDTFIKGNLRKLKEKNILIKVFFRITCVAVPAVLLFSCFLPEDVPKYLSFFAMAFLGVILLSRFVRKEWMAGTLQVTIYLLIPFVIYLSEVNMTTWMNAQFRQLYNFSFIVLAFFVILTVKFSKRKKGFKTNPMDFLILFIALVIPNLPGQIQTYHMGLMTAKIIVLFFSCEVLMKELREEPDRQGLTTIAALGIIVVRGFV
jgi:UDP-GlcNAc:undecaprenyl-phosphate GlcNAc-1-phosphate transferase